MTVPPTNPIQYYPQEPSERYPQGPPAPNNPQVPDNSYPQAPGRGYPSGYYPGGNVPMKTKDEAQYSTWRYTLFPFSLRI